MNRFLTLASLLVLTACGGIADSTLLTDLTEEDAPELCADFADTPSRTVTCEVEGVEYDVEIGFFDSETQCVADFEPFDGPCDATVGDMRDCLDAMLSMSDEDVCDPNNTEPPAECAAVFACSE